MDRMDPGFATTEALQGFPVLLLLLNTPLYPTDTAGLELSPTLASQGLPVLLLFHTPLHPMDTVGPELSPTLASQGLPVLLLLHTPLHPMDRVDPGF